MMRGFLRGKRYQGIVMVDDVDVDFFLGRHWNVVLFGKIKKTKYCVRSVYVGPGRWEKQLFHRTLMERIIGVSIDRTLQVDHINHDGLDNRRENLRIVTNSQNQQNTSASCSDGKLSKFKGVTWNVFVKKWQVQAAKNGIHYRLGYFVDEVEAALQYDQAAYSLFGGFAFVNFPNIGVDQFWCLTDKSTHKGRALRGRKKEDEYGFSIVEVKA